MPVPARSGQRLGCAFVRAPQDLPRRTRRGPRRGRFWLVVAIIVVIVLFASLRTIATFYTDYLWFGSVHLGGVWRRLLEVKAGLVLRIRGGVRRGPVGEPRRRGSPGTPRARPRPRGRACAPRTSSGSPRGGARAHRGVGGHRPDRGVGRHRAVAELPPVHERPPFSGPIQDPQFHKNVGFFVFKLPFLAFIVSWAFVSLVVIAVITVIAHYLNGGIRVQSGRPRASAQVKVHLSVLLAVHGSGEGRRLRPGAATTWTCRRTATCRGPATPTSTPACRHSPCSSGSRSWRPSSFSSTSVDGVGRFPSWVSGCGRSSPWWWVPSTRPSSKP